MIKKPEKIILLKKLNNYLLKIKNKKSVLVGGCFDLIHYGHLVFLRQAKKAGDFLIILLESDQFIKEKKRRIPIHTQRERAEILAELSLVDWVILLPYIFFYKDYLKIIKQIRPTVIAVTESDPQIENKRRQAKIAGSKLKIVTPLINDFSTKNILKTF